MTDTEQSTIPIDHIVKATILITASAYNGEREENIFVRQWAEKHDLTCGMALAHEEGYAELTSSGETLVRKSLSALAETIGVSDDRLVDIAFGIDEEISLT